ncbi:hypothetical protein KCU93_g425, partial [Aureobasidium melanogenum]
LFPNLKFLGVHSFDKQFAHLDPLTSEDVDEYALDGLSQLNTILQLAPRLEKIEFPQVASYDASNTIPVHLTCASLETPTYKAWTQIALSNFQVWKSAEVVQLVLVKIGKLIHIQAELSQIDLLARLQARTRISLLACERVIVNVCAYLSSLTHSISLRRSDSSCANEAAVSKRVQACKLTFHPSVQWLRWGQLRAMEYRAADVKVGDWISGRDCCSSKLEGYIE